MKVIFLKDVARVGQRDTVKEIADGYALNFLIPQGFAEQATPERLAALQKRQASAQSSAQSREKEWAAAARKLQGARIVVAANANDQGHLYREVKEQLIIEGIKEECGIEVPPGSIHLEQSIKTTGEFPAEFKMGGELARFTLDVMKAES